MNIITRARLLQRIIPANPAMSFSSHSHPPKVSVDYPIGNREVVGFGFNGMPIYYDRPDYPMPAIRFKTPTPDIQAVREKEKGDWKKLTLDEKKLLYRASFCQTYAEMMAPTGEWKTILGCALGFISAAIWVYLGLRAFVYSRELPESFQLERQQAQLQRMIDISVNPIEGLTSKWDYEKGEWKK